TVFALDRLQSQLDAARTAVTKASRRYRVADAKTQALADHEQELTRQADTAGLLSDQLDLQKRAVLFGVGVDAAQQRANRLKTELQAAQAKLASLRQQASGASFNAPARRLLSGAPAQ